MGGRLCPEKTKCAAGAQRPGGFYPLLRMALSPHSAFHPTLLPSHNMYGVFIAKFKNLSNSIPQPKQETQQLPLWNLTRGIRSPQRLRAVVSHQESPPAAKTKQQLVRQQHSKKPFLKMNGISRLPGLSTVPSVLKAQVSTRPRESGQSDGEAQETQDLDGKLKQQGPKCKHFRKAAFPNKVPPLKSKDSETPAVPTPSKICATPRPKNLLCPLGKTKRYRK